MVFSKKPQPDMLRGYKVVAQAEPRPAPGIETSAVLKVEKEQKEEELSVKAVSVNPILSNESIRQAVINRPTPQEVQSMIDRYAGEYGVDPGMMKKIASCESGFRSEENAGP